MSSSLQTFVRLLRLGFINFWRNRWLTLGATLLMTLTLIMISVSLLVTFVIRDTTEIIRQKIDLTIYFRDDTVPDSKIQALADQIKTLTHVNGTTFVDKNAALAIWNRLPINEDIKKPVTQQNNPLPRSIQIAADSPDNIQTIVNDITTVDKGNLICSECVSYSKNKNTVNHLVSITKFVQRAGLFLSLFFAIIAIFNVFNIIRITINARSDEIEIMRYVGASNMFVRGPFIVEGMFYGLLGTVLTTIFILIIAWAAAPVVNLAFSVLNIDFFQYVLRHMGELISLQLLLGVFLGVAVSMVTMRRYLRA